MTPSEVRDLQSRLDDEQHRFSGGAALASQNFLLERFQEAEARAEPPPVLLPPVVVTQYASDADSYETTPEILERPRRSGSTSATASTRKSEMTEGRS